MNRLWTPWRMEYVSRPKEKGCIFEAGGDEAADREALVLHRGGGVVILLNRYPYANGHLLVAPEAHLADITDLSPEDSAALMQALARSVAILRETLRPDGFNLGLNLGETAGAGIPGHLHFHVVPRWSGDHNFMAVLADVKTIPEHIDATWERLRPLFTREFRGES